MGTRREGTRRWRGSGRGATGAVAEAAVAAVAAAEAAVAAVETAKAAVAGG